MAPRLTNNSLGQLLLSLGFQQRDVAGTRYRAWRHPESGCELVLPANKAMEAPRPADVVGIKAQLVLHGHLDEESFDFFASEGRLPDRSAVQPG
jgi:hypothetical protein